MSEAIGIFDSGLGGLTVLRYLAEKFPNESFVYLGDIARLPYGNKSPETIRKYGLQILRFLKEKKVKALIIACNSASSVFLDEDDFEGIPLLNVIGPGSKAALEVSVDKKIAIVGTSATVRSGAYKKTISKLSPAASVKEVSCPLLVPLVEEGMAGDEIARLVLERYLKEIKNEKFETVILGCTHYPVLKEDFKKVLGPEVKLVESGAVLTQKILELMGQGKILKTEYGGQEIELNITDLTDQFEVLAKKLMAPLEIKSLNKVAL